MASSVVQICNIALSQLGEKRIASLTEDNEPARLCDLRYGDARDAVLRAHPWNAAIKRQALAELTAEPIFEWDHQYQLPSDCLRALEIDSDFATYRGHHRHRGHGGRAGWVIEGRRLLTDETSVKLKYIARITDVTLFDPLLVQAIAARLAWDLGEALPKDAALARRMGEKYLALLAEARSVDGQEGIPQYDDATAWLDARWE